MAEHEPLVTAADLTAYGVETSDTALIDTLISAVSAGIRDAAGVPITLTETTTTLAGRQSQFLDLPGGPIQDVASVTREGSPVEDYKLRDGRLWRRHGWGDISEDVEVTYLHGWDPVPADVVKLAINLVSAGVREASDGLAQNRGVVSRQESIDDYSRQVSYARGENEIVDLTEIPQRTRDWLRSRFGRSAHVTEGVE